MPAAHLGVTRFGQSGDLDSVYRAHGLDVDSLVGAALDLVDRAGALPAAPRPGERVDMTT